MLKFFRNKKVAKMVFWFLIVLIVPAFVFWGSASTSGSKEKRPTYAGIINNNKVSFDDLFRSIVSMRCQIMLGGIGNQPQIVETLLKDETFLAKMAWDRLVMLREAQRYRIKASDKDVVDYITSYPLFVRDGVFDKQVYEHFLRYAVGLDPRAFEEIVRENVKIKALNDMLSGDITTDEDEILREYRRENGKFKISYVRVNPEDYLSKVNIDDNALKDYYEKNKDQFAIHEKEPSDNKSPSFAKFKEVKEGIKSYMAEKEAKALAAKEAKELYDKINESVMLTMTSFEDAASKLNLKVSESPLFSRSDYLEGLGEASPLADEAAKLGKDQISPLTETRGGFLIFKVVETQDIDQEKFKKEKDEFSKRVLINKKDKFLTDWLRRTEEKATLKIDLSKLNKYFR